MALVPSTEITRVKESVRRFASGFTPGQKAVTIAAVVGAVAIGITYIALSGKPTYGVLFSGLQAQDAASVTQQLTTDHVPYQLENGGSTILVPENDVAQARLTAAAAGLPAQSTVGLSLLTKTGLTTSQLTQQADYLQAIQGELEQTIDAISGVNSSQVNVAEAANQTFALNNTNPTGASVLVTMDAGRSLTQGEVQAIVHLVASSVPGLSSSDVTVADNDGDLLAGPGVSGTAAQNTQTASYDATVQAKIQSYLASIFGTGNSDVQVAATLNFNKVKTSTHQLVPGTTGTVPSFCTSTQKSSTTYTGTGTPPGGTAGTATVPTNTSGTGKYTQTSTSQTCETSTQSQTVTQAPGTVVRQSIAVLVNSKSVPKGATMRAIRSGVAAAADLQTSRGDVLSMTVAPFSNAASTQAAAAANAAASASKHSQLVEMLKDAVAALVVLGLILLIWLSYRRRPRTAAPVPVIDPALMVPRPQAPFLEEHPTAEFPSVRLPVAQDPSWGIQQFIDEQPAEVASVLRTWLHQDAAVGAPANGDQP